MRNLMMTAEPTWYAARVRQLEAEDMTTSDAQGVADLEAIRLLEAGPEILEELRGLADVLAYIHDDMGRHNCTIDCPDIRKHVESAKRIAAKAMSGA